MKHLVTCAAILFMMSFCLPVQAQIPHTFSFQGVLTDADGQPVEDGIRPVTFALYENELSSVPSWTETQMLDVRDGVFNAMLGTVNPFTIDFDQPWLLGIAVDGAEELLPRTPLTSAPYAMHAAVAGAAGGLLPGSGGAVTSLNALTGALTLEGAGGTTVSSTGNTITISSGTGGAGIARLLNSDGTMSILHPTGPETTLGILDGGIGESKLADLSVSTPKLANLAVTMGKLADNAVTAAKIDVAAVTPAKISAAGASLGQVLAYDGAAVAWSTPASSGVTGTAAPGQLAVWDAATNITGNAELVYDGMKLGVGTANPEASLHVVGDDGILASGSVGTGATMNPGPGVRMHWYPRRAAFRAGSVNGTQWDEANVGSFSIAAGDGSIASGPASVAMGYETTAAADVAVAFGYMTKAEGDVSFACGIETFAAGINAFAAGYQTLASGRTSTAMGFTTKAEGDGSFACGLETFAEGRHAVAMGDKTHAGGMNSTAMGFWTVASGSGAVAIGSKTEAQGGLGFAAGLETLASGYIAVAMGYQTVAEGNTSLATGFKTTASGSFAVAMGSNTAAREDFATAFGSGSVAAGRASFATGLETSAGGIASTAMGYKTTASGDYSTALGAYARTTGNRGAFAIGDFSHPTPVSCSAPNQMSMRFAGGYQLFTSADMTTGAFLPPGASGWSVPSDRNKKENFTHIDGEALLESIRQLPVTEWNYIGADPSMRYIGPMAQDFQRAFGLGGSDSLSINSIAIDGVNLAAIKALEVRTRELRAALARSAELESRVAALERLLVEREGASVLQTRIEELETRVDALLKHIHREEPGEIHRVRTTHQDAAPAGLQRVTEVRQ